VSWRKIGCLCMSESRRIDYKHWTRRKNRPFWQCCWVRALWPTIATAEPDGRAQGRIGSRSSPVGQRDLRCFLFCPHLQCQMLPLPYHRADTRISSSVVSLSDKSFTCRKVGGQTIWPGDMAHTGSKGKTDINDWGTACGINEWGTACGNFRDQVQYLYPTKNYAGSLAQLFIFLSESLIFVPSQCQYLYEPSNGCKSQLFYLFREWEYSCHSFSYRRFLVGACSSCSLDQSP
jgi:hypothetical protein